MSLYLDMWAKVKELTPQETRDWINVVTPLKGIVINFRGVRVIDVDVHEALNHWLEDAIYYEGDVDLRQPNFD